MATLPAATSFEELRVADRGSAVELDWIQVNSSAAVPTTRTSITMPFRKNLGFKRSLRGRASDDRAAPVIPSIASSAVTTP